MRITKPAGRNSERLIANQVLQNKDWFRVVRSLSLSLPPFEVEKMEDSITLRDSSSYGMRSALFPAQDKHIQFETQDDGVYNQPQSPYYQQKIPLLPKSLETTNIESD